MADTLAPLEREVLEFARLRWKYLGTKETAIRERFRWSLTKYSAVLNELLDRPAAVAYDAQLVDQLRRLRDRRAAARSTARLGGGR